MQPSEIVVGAALSSSGRFAVQGRQARNGLTLWAEQANAAGGMSLGPDGQRRPVHLVLVDDESRASVCAQRVAALLDDVGVDLLIGPYGSATTLAATAVAEARERVLWNHGGSTDALDARGCRHLVSLLSPASAYFVGLLDLVRTHAPRARRLAIAHGAHGSFGPAVARGAAGRARALGFELVLEAIYPPDVAGRPVPSHYARLAADVRQARPDVILGAGTADADLAFVRALLQEVVAPTAVGVVAAGIGRAADLLGSDVDGLFGSSQWEPGLNVRPDLGPTARAFARAYRRRYGEPPDYPAAQAYAAGLIAEACAAHAGTLDDGALFAAANGLQVETLYGRFALDPVTLRQVGHQSLTVQWQDGKRQIVWPAAVAEARPRLVVGGS